MAPDASTSPVGHTPGPWGCQPVERDGPDCGVTIIGLRLDSDGAPLHSPTNGLVGAALPWPTEVDSGDMSRVEANARLMAAAPELLEALSDIIAHYGDREQGPGHSHTVKGIWDKDVSNGAKGGTVCDWCAKWGRASAAIAKARGTPPAPEVSHVG